MHHFCTPEQNIMLVMLWITNRYNKRSTRFTTIYHFLSTKIQTTVSMIQLEKWELFSFCWFTSYFRNKNYIEVYNKYQTWLFSKCPMCKEPRKNQEIFFWKYMRGYNGSTSFRYLKFPYSLTTSKKQFFYSLIQ